MLFNHLLWQSVTQLGTPGGTASMFLYFLSHVWNSWTHRSSPLIKAKARKHCIIFAAIPWWAASCHFKLLIMRQVQHLHVTTLFEFQPTCKPTARMGGDNVSLARQYGGRRQRNWHSFGQSLHPSRASDGLMEMRRVTTATPLQGAVCVHFTTLKN